MKKIVLSLGIAMVLLSSCGGIESDAKKVAELTCKMSKELSPSKREKIQKEIQELMIEIGKKYPEQDGNEFEKMLEKAIKNCK